MVQAREPHALAAAREGRVWVRSVGAVCAEAVLSAALRHGAGPLLYTRWPRGIESTCAHSERRPACGVRITESLREHHGRLARYAATVHAKGTGIVLGYAASRTDGSANDDIESITALLGDADGVGDWDGLAAFVERIGLAAILQRSGGHTLEKPKWHAILPLAAPLSARPGESTREWPARIRYEVGFALGVLSELAGLDERRSTPSHMADAGFDASIANRLCQPSYPGCRRTPSAPVPETRLYEGRPVDLAALLEAAGYTAPTRHARKSAALDAEASTAWLEALRVAGLLGQEIAPGKHAALCPNRAAHTAGHDSDGTSSTVAFASGGFKCFRGACAHVTGPWVREWLRTHHPHAAAFLEEQRDTAGVRRLRAMLTEPREVAPLETIGQRVQESIAQHEPGTLTIVAGGVGTGKSRVAIEAALERDEGAMLAYPTNALADEWRRTTEPIARVAIVPCCASSTR